jgi:hypothetical protein
VRGFITSSLLLHLQHHTTTQQLMDLLTQLQSKVDALSERFYTYVGVLGVAPLTPEQPDIEQVLRNAESYAEEIATLSKEIEQVLRRP